MLGRHHIPKLTPAGSQFRPTLFLRSIGFHRNGTVIFSTLYKGFSMRRFTKDHEWIEIDDLDNRVAKIGITDIAEKALGDVVYVELPTVGEQVSAKSVIGIVESVKGASDVFSPVAGKIYAVNEDLAAKPSLINKDPFSKGWLCQIAMDDASSVKQLMEESAYREFCRKKPL